MPLSYNLVLIRTPVRLAQPRPNPTVKSFQGLFLRIIGRTRNLLGEPLAFVS
jgi:hypothetical protein